MRYVQIVHFSMFFSFYLVNAIPYNFVNAYDPPNGVIHLVWKDTEEQ